MTPETSSAIPTGRFLQLNFSNDLQEIVTLAAAACNTPAAALFLADRTDLWVSRRTGVDGRTVLPAAVAGMRSIRHGAASIPLDGMQDLHVAQRRFKACPAGLRFYAGMPLQDPEGCRFGTLCVIDHQPRTIAPEQVTVLRLLSKQVVRLTRLANALCLRQQAPQDIDVQRKRILAQSRSLQGIVAYLAQGA